MFLLILGSEEGRERVKFSKIKLMRFKELSFSLKSYPYCSGLKFISSHNKKQEDRKSSAWLNRVGTGCQPLLRVFVFVFPLVCDTPKPLFPVVSRWVLCLSPLKSQECCMPFWQHTLRALKCSSSLWCHMTISKNFSSKTIIRNTLKEACGKNFSLQHYL